MSQSVLYKSNAQSNYPPMRVLINNCKVDEEVVVTEACANNPVLLLATMYGKQAQDYYDLFLAANHITDPFTQLPAGKVVKKVSILDASSIANSGSTSAAQKTTKVKHAKVSGSKVSY